MQKDCHPGILDTSKNHRTRPMHIHCFVFAPVCGQYLENHKTNSTCNEYSNMSTSTSFKIKSGNIWATHVHITVTNINNTFFNVSIMIVLNTTYPIFKKIIEYPPHHHANAVSGNFQGAPVLCSIDHTPDLAWGLRSQDVTGGSSRSPGCKLIWN